MHALDELIDGFLSKNAEPGADMTRDASGQQERLGVKEVEPAVGDSRHCRIALLQRLARQEVLKNLCEGKKGYSLNQPYQDSVRAQRAENRWNDSDVRMLTETLSDLHQQ